MANITLAQKAKIEKHLNSLINVNGVVKTNRAFIQDLINLGWVPLCSSVKGWDIPGKYNRSKYNRLSGPQQTEYENKLNEFYTVYSIEDPTTKRSYDINKTLYDYALSLVVVEL